MKANEKVKDNLSLRNIGGSICRRIAFSAHSNCIQNVRWF